MKCRAHYRIIKLLDLQGEELNTHKEMESIMVQHFQSIVEETIADGSQFIKSFTKNIPKLVTKEEQFCALGVHVFHPPISNISDEVGSISQVSHKRSIQLDWPVVRASKRKDPSSHRVIEEKEIL